jgi:hypothetical protein
MSVQNKPYVTFLPLEWVKIFSTWRKSKSPFLLNYLYVISKLDCSPDSCLRSWHFQCTVQTLVFHMMLALVHCMVANAFKGSKQWRSFTVLGNICNLHPSIFEALIKKNHKIKFCIWNDLYPIFLMYISCSIILYKWNKNISWEQSDLCMTKK